MNSIILRTASNYLLPLLLLFSVFVLLRGHYLPGGGFIGGLIASIAFILHAFGHGLKKTKLLLRIHPGYLMPAGLTLAVVSGIFPLISDDLPLMTGIWMHDPLPVIGLVGTALFFDTGVYLVVIGVTLTIILTIAESA